MTLTAVLLCVGLSQLRAGSPDPPLSPGFEHFYNLEYRQAITEFRAETLKDPNNPESWNHLAQALLYSEMFRAGALESELVSGSNPFVRREKMQPSPAVAREFNDCISRTLQLGEARVAKDPKDADALYAMGVAYGLRANYNYLVRKAWMDALKDSGNARKMHNQVAQLRPNDIDCRLVEGLYQYLVGSLPWHIRALGLLAGYKGDREGGIRIVKLVSEQARTNRYDARVMLAAIYRRERRPLDALPLVHSLSERFPRNYLLRLEQVQMYSDAGQKEPALEVLSTIEAEKKTGDPSLAALPIEKVYYYRGNLLFWYRDYDEAISNLKRVTPNTSVLDPHSAVMAWMRLGQCYDMKGDRRSAQTAYREAYKLGPETDPGKESRSYLNSAYRRPANV